MFRQNPATGAWEDDTPPEFATGQVGQQERDALSAPAFVGESLPPPPPPVPGPEDLGGSDQEGLADIGTADAPPIPEEPVAESPLPPLDNIGLPEGDQALADAGQTNVPDIGEPPGLPVTPEPAASDSSPMAPPSLDDYGVPMGTKPGEVVPGSDSETAPVPPIAPPLSPTDQLTADKIALAKREGEHRARVAEAEQRRADAELERKIEAKKETDQIIADGQARLADRNARKQAEYDQFREMSVRDSWGDHGTALRVMAGIAMLLGGRGAAGAYIVGASQGLEEKKKAELALQEKRLEHAGKSYEEAKQQTAEEFATFKMRQAAALDVTAARMEQEMRAQGIEEAKIVADKNILQVRAEAEKAKIEERKLAHKEAEDKIRDDLNDAYKRGQIEHMKNQDQAARDRLAKTKAAGAGKNATYTPAEIELKRMAGRPDQYSGDQMAKFAADNKIAKKSAEEIISKTAIQSKTTADDKKSAEQGRQGLRAITEIEQSGYKPTRADVQQWMKNQKQVEIAESAGKSGGVSGLIGGLGASYIQGKGLIAQHETDGMSPAAAAYFANVRQYMEVMGREQSGAAISEREWKNFYSQFGPNSQGGYAAARAKLEDKMASSGGAGRQIQEGTGKTAAGTSLPVPVGDVKAMDAETKRLENAQRAKSIKAGANGGGPGKGGPPPDQVQRARDAAGKGSQKAKDWLATWGL